MIKLELAIGKSIYKIECLESEKETLERLAFRLNERVNKATLALRNLDEKTILIISALMIEGELENAAENFSAKENEKESGELSEEDIYDAVNKIRNYQI